MNLSSEENCAVIDFSQVTENGIYKITTPKGLESYNFEINDNVYNVLFTSSLEMLYTQRCGTNVIGGFYQHGVCHEGLARVYGTDLEIDVTGGWHDAGDYGKYIVPGAKTVEDLLLIYELYGDVFKYNVEIEEKNNNIPDILDEAIYELDWMLKMQKENGEVYHKISSYYFPGDNVLADEDHLEMVVSPVFFAATADFAASMASASRILKDIDPDRANLYLEASIKAYNALENMTIETYKNPSDISTGEYPDEELDDEYLWASAELYRTTNNVEYKIKFDASLSNIEINNVAFGWDNMYGYALYSYEKSINDTNNNAFEILKNKANKYEENILSDSYGSAIGLNYCLGSNLDICNSTLLFILLNDLGENKYINYL